MRPATVTPPRVAIVDTKTGFATRSFFDFIQQLFRNFSTASNAVVLTADDQTDTFPNSLVLTPATGDLERLLATDSFTLGLADTAVTPGTYGGASHTVSIEFDAKGRGVGASSIALNFANIAGTVGVAQGGTNLTSYTVGDILYASATTTLSKLANVATGNVLLSGGVGVASAWGKVGLTTHVSGILPEANGGTGTATAGFTGTVAPPLSLTFVNGKCTAAT